MHKINYKNRAVSLCDYLDLHNIETLEGILIESDLLALKWLSFVGRGHLTLAPIINVSSSLPNWSSLTYFD